MPAPTPYALTDLHAVMDEVSALQQAGSSGHMQRQQLVRRVRDTYVQMGVPVEVDLIEQAVAKCLTTSVDHQSPTENAFDFGWARPNDVGRWERRVNRDRRLTHMARGALGAASTGAFVLWLWMVLGTVPATLDHPWWFALLSMGAGSVIETWIEARARHNRRWVAARKPSRKQLRKWSQSPQALAYLGAVLDSPVPLLNADLPHLRQRAQKDEQHAAVRSMLG